jgi:pantoate kinase
MNAKAFCPGHVTGFFQICETKNILSTGSRGAGICLTRGAVSSVSVEEAQRQSVLTYLDGKMTTAEVTRVAIRRMIGREKVKVTVETALQLPQSQGFGMSAAGALSASIALADLLGRTRHEAFEAAHVAEVQCRSGLGDVSAIWRGGITIRKKAGLPPIGEVLRIKGTPEVTLAVVGRKLLTKKVLADPAKRKAINSSGSRKVDELLQEPTLEKLMELSASFALQSGMASRKIIDAMNTASKLGMASMAMLGNSVFAIGDSAGQAKVLKGYGDVWTCRVSTKGPRVL